jgi:hypothetical protein
LASNSAWEWEIGDFVGDSSPDPGSPT